MAENGGSSFLWFLTGLGVGAALGVLYAPQSGRETRETLCGSAGDVSDRAQRVRQQANTWVDRGREVLNQQKEQFRSAYDAGRQAYREVTSTGEPEQPR
jgi:gas vesicle protein